MGNAEIESICAVHMMMLLLRLGKVLMLRAFTQQAQL